MKYTPKQYAQALHQAVFESAPEYQEKILDNFVLILKRNGDLGKVNEIEQEFLRYERERKGIKEATVTSTRKLSGHEEKAIISELNELAGGHVELKQKIDKNLIGGVVVQLGDIRIDGSLRKNIQDLKDQLVKE